MWLKNTYFLFFDGYSFSIQNLKGTSWSSFALSCKQGVTDLELIDSNAEDYFFSLQQKSTKNSPEAFLQSSVLNSPFAHIYLVIPDHWTTQITGPVDTYCLAEPASVDIHRLAGLALASEVSQLAPELVHYCFRIENNQELTVVACPSSIPQRVESFLENKKQLKGVITASDCLCSLKESVSFKQFSEKLRENVLSTYQQKILSASQVGKRLGTLIIFILMTQLSLLTWYHLTLNDSAKIKMLIRTTQEQTVHFASIDKNPSYNVAVEALKTLPLTVRFNEFHSQKTTSSLSLTGLQTMLDKLIESWRDRWPNFSFQLVPINHPQRTRSVHDVVIEIKGITTETSSSQ